VVNIQSFTGLFDFCSLTFYVVLKAEGSSSRSSESSAELNSIHLLQQSQQISGLENYTKRFGPSLSHL
jgi:hypothetical protein